MAMYIVCLFLLGWAACDRTPARGARIDVQASNLSGAEINDAEVLFGKSKCYFGVLSPGKGATHMFYDGSISENAIVRWTDSNGSKVEKKANIAKVYNLKDSGILHLKIGTNDIQVMFTPRNG